MCLRRSNIVFEGIRHYVQQDKKGKTAASKVVFDIFNNYRRRYFLHIFAFQKAVPILFGEFFPVKNFHTFSPENKISFTLARFLLWVGKDVSFLQKNKLCDWKCGCLSTLYTTYCISRTYRSFTKTFSNLHENKSENVKKSDVNSR